MRMDEMIERLKEALKSEFAFLGATEEAWDIAARGIIDKMNLDSFVYGAATCYYFYPRKEEE